jgi:hypothetical protein
VTIAASGHGSGGGRTLPNRRLRISVADATLGTTALVPSKPVLICGSMRIT